jgi:hypothetical protein
VGNQILDPDPGEDQETGVLDHPEAMDLLLLLRPSNPEVSDLPHKKAVNTERNFLEPLLHGNMLNGVCGKTIGKIQELSPI